MNTHKFSNEKFLKVPIVGIVRGMPFKVISNLLAVYADAGLTTIEITMNTAGALEMIEFIIKNYSGRLNIGAGTVCTQQQLEQALAAGAQFIVTPIVKPAVISSCAALDIPVFPGAFTPTEIYNAWDLGASMVKVFPASKLGPDYIKEVKAPLDQIKLMPTGGITLDNIEAYRQAGADGYGMAGSLFDKQIIANEDWAGLCAHLKKFADIFN